MPSTSRLAVEHISVDALRADPANPRRISDDVLEALTRSLTEFGFVQPVIARRTDQVVIAGHQRLVAARRAGHTTVPVIFVDLSTERARLLGLALNRIAGTWDEQLLARLLAELNATPISTCAYPASPMTNCVPCCGASRRATSAIDPSRSIWRRHSPTWGRGPSWVICGSLATTACCAATRQVRTTWRAWSAMTGRAWLLPTRRTTSITGAMVGTSAARRAVRSPMTRSRLWSGRPSSRRGPTTCWRPPMAPCMSA